MKTILTRLFTIAVLMMVSMAVGAKVDVELNKEYSGGKVTVKSQEDKSDGSTLVTITVSPGNGYTITHNEKKKSVIVYAVLPAEGQRNTRAPEISSELEVTGPTDKISYPNSVDYQFFTGCINGVVSTETGMRMPVVFFTFVPFYDFAYLKITPDDVEVFLCRYIFKLTVLFLSQTEPAEEQEQIAFLYALILKMPLSSIYLTKSRNPSFWKFVSVVSSDVRIQVNTHATESFAWFQFLHNGSITFCFVMKLT